MRWCFHLLPALVLLTLTACGPTEFFGRSSTPRKSLLPGKTENPSSSPSSLSVTLQPKIHLELEAENYCSALNLVRKAIKRGVPETALADEYGQAIDGILIEARQYQQDGLPEKAGELFRTAHDGFPETEEVAEKVSVTPSAISARIEECAEKLMERGLVAYRSGDLDEAIRIWKMIHTFNPRHQASLKALETAEIQLSNLEKVSTQ
jgi:tetratricopeptide (TPR) repeat protein